MSHPSKVKGNSFERELVTKAKEAGLDSQRAWGSNGASLGKYPEVDLTIDVYDIQAKRRKALPAYLQVPDCCDAVIFRQDRGTTLVLMELDEWLSIIKELKALSNKQQNKD